MRLQKQWNKMHHHLECFIAKKVQPSSQTPQSFLPSIKTVDTLAILQKQWNKCTTIWSVSLQKKFNPQVKLCRASFHHWKLWTLLQFFHFHNNLLSGFEDVNKVVVNWWFFWCLWCVFLMSWKNTKNRQRMADLIFFAVHFHTNARGKYSNLCLFVLRPHRCPWKQAMRQFLQP